MGTLANGTVVAPFANAAMRLLREDWKGKYGSKMLSEELYPILQTGIPQPDQQFQNFITINAGVNDTFAKLIDQFGDIQYTIDAHNGLQKVESPGYPPPKLKPRIVWGPHTIAAGGSISGTELDAVAVDPETGAVIPGSYLYTPPSGTTFSTAGTSTLYVNFAPTDGVKYRRSAGSTVLTITGTPSLKIPDLNWTTPDDIWLGTALSGTQLNCTATDPDTFAPVAGVFVYTPPSGTVLTRGDQSLAVDFTPTNGAVYDVADAGNAIVVRGVYLITNGLGSGNNAGPFTVQAGDLIVICASTTTVNGATVGVTDTGGNSYSQAGGYVRVNVGGNFLSFSIWYTFASAPGTITATIAPSGGSSLSTRGSGHFRGALAFDQLTSGSGTGSEALTAGTCPVSVDNELVVMFTDSNLDGLLTAKSQWTTSNTFRLYNNVSTAANNSNGVAPKDGANVAVDPVLSGTAPAATPWAILAASFTHRTS